MLFWSQDSKLPKRLKGEVGLPIVGREEGHWPHSLTRPPQLLALLLVGEAHAVVAVSLAALTGGAVHLVEVGGTMGRLARAELWEVALPCLLPAQGARGQQLSRGMRGKHSQSFSCPQPYQQRTHEHHSCGTEFPITLTSEHLWHDLISSNHQPFNMNSDLEFSRLFHKC